jgi:hypothetical protein
MEETHYGWSDGRLRKPKRDRSAAVTGGIWAERVRIRCGCGTDGCAKHLAVQVSAPPLQRQVHGEAVRSTSPDGESRGRRDASKVVAAGLIWEELFVACGPRTGSRHAMSAERWVERDATRALSASNNAYGRSSGSSVAPLISPSPAGGTAAGSILRHRTSRQRNSKHVAERVVPLARGALAPVAACRSLSNVFDRVARGLNKIQGRPS